MVASYGVRTNDPQIGLQMNVESDATYTYYALAEIGTALATNLWSVFRIETATTKKQYAVSNGVPTGARVFAGQTMSGQTYAWS